MGNCQVVEMSNGQQLEMVDGSLIEIRPASLQVRLTWRSTIPKRDDLQTARPFFFILRHGVVIKADRFEQLDEGDVVGHRIIELETSRKIAAAAAAGQAGRHMAQDPPTPSHPRQHLASDFSNRDRPMPVCD